jgi:dipeptidyl aminopeptidase/acylaminoacyl peptidase
MKRIYFLIFYTLAFLPCKAQKPPISIDSYKSWLSVDEPGISNDGKFAYYKIKRVDEPWQNGRYIIKSTEKREQFEFGPLNDISFSDDSRTLWAKTDNDTLMILNLYSGSIKRVMNVTSYKLFTSDKTQWVAIISSGSLQIYPTNGSKKGFEFANVKNYFISPDLSSIIIEQLKDKKNQNEKLIWLSLKTGGEKVIYTGNKINNFIFDKYGRQAAFVVTNLKANTIWYYSKELDGAIQLIDNNSKGLNKNIEIKAPKIYANCWKFSQNCKYLFFPVNEANEEKKNSSNQNVLIWNYQDAFLQIDSLESRRRPARPKQLLAAIDLKSKSIVQLTFKNDEIINESPNTTPDQFIVIETVSDVERQKVFSDLYRKKSYYLLSTETGDRFPIKLDVTDPLKYLNISPTGKYLVYYDAEKSSYISYSIKDHKSISISEGINEQLYKLTAANFPKPNYDPVGISGWLPEDKSLIINGTYNLWQVDPTGKKKPFNLTHISGQKKQIIFYLPTESYSLHPDRDGKIIISAFDLNTKGYSVYKLKIGERLNSDSLKFKNYFISELQIIYTKFSTDNFIKARDVNNYLFKWQSVDRAPNYYLTSDFNRYEPLTHIKPEKDYNWMTSELHRYKDISGNDLEGILYKPENFDSSKKYPIIFNYYELKSAELNLYISPNDINGDIPIAWLVSNGYLVFKPNIHSEPRKIGDGALRSVNAAVDYLLRYNWIDSTKMAVCGHSFGGFETNYIVTHSNRFAAAVSAAGISNMIDYFNDNTANDGQQTFVTLGQDKMISSLTEDINLYVENSPILFAKHMQTPLLIMHNPGDGRVSFSQGLTFFIELRSLRKPVWMLTYRDDKHGIGDNNTIDYYTRLSQFLDFHLKNSPIPDWMAQPIGQ